MPFLVSTPKGGAAFIKRYFYSSSSTPHPASLTLALLNDGRSFAGRGADDVGPFSLQGRLVMLSGHSCLVAFDKDYHRSHSVQYRGRCDDLRAARFTGTWSIAGGWAGSGRWDMAPRDAGEALQVHSGALLPGSGGGEGETLS